MFEKLWKKIIRRRRFSLYLFPAILLWIASIFYRLAFKLNLRSKKVTAKTETPLVSIGNITVGGTGKTPIVACIAQYLETDGFDIGIVSSGYGRKSEESIVLPGYKIAQLDASKVGDEVSHLAELLPNVIFSVAPKKSEAAINLEKEENVDVILVDDGYQHFELHRDLNIVTFDAGVKSKYLKPFPYGLMRESFAGLSRADIIIITRSDFAGDLANLIEQLSQYNPTADIYHARFAATEIIGKEQSYPVKYLQDKSVFLFAGIGNFKMLRKQVSTLCAQLDYAMELSDHQEYTKKLLKRIKQLADKEESDLILTTGKDIVKLGDFDFQREIYYLNQEIDLDPGEEKLSEQIQHKLQLKRVDL